MKKFREARKSVAVLCIVLMAATVQGDVVRSTAIVPGAPTLSGANTFEGVTTFSSRILLPNGTAAAPSISFTSVSNLGIYSDQSGLVLQGPGSEKWFYNGNNLSAMSTGVFGWAQSSTPWDTVDLSLRREAAAILQLGADVNGAAVEQTVKSHDGITGTDVAGADINVAGGRGTGAGAPGSVITQTSNTLGTGTTAQTLIDRNVVVGKTVTLTDATATAIATVAVPSNSTTGGIIVYTIQGTESTNYQARAGSVGWSVVNNGGTETCVFATAADTDNTPTGTLTNTWDCDTTGTNSAIIRATADSSLTAPVVTITFQIYRNGGTGAITF